MADDVNNDDAVTKGQLDKKPDLTAVMLLNGQNHMTKDLDMRGKKLSFLEELK